MVKIKVVWRCGCNELVPLVRKKHWTIQQAIDFHQRIRAKYLCNKCINFRS